MIGGKNVGGDKAKLFNFLSSRSEKYLKSLNSTAYRFKKYTAFNLATRLKTVKFTGLNITCSLYGLDYGNFFRKSPFINLQIFNGINGILIKSTVSKVNYLKFC